jgi:hypothetical protein
MRSSAKSVNVIEAEPKIAGKDRQSIYIYIIESPTIHFSPHRHLVHEDCHPEGRDRSRCLC